MNNSQKIIRQEAEAIKTALKKFKEGAPIEAIEATAGIIIERRTLQRRLKELIKEGVLRSAGKGRAIKYHLLTPETENIPSGQTITTILPLSDAGMEIQRKVSQPIQQRDPVGYNRAFLELYKPNITSYLTTEEKQRLGEIGKTESMNEPAGTYAKEILQRLLIDLSWNSSRLEGNTYSLLDTQRLISEGVWAENKSAKEAQMILNHKDAIEFIVRNTEEIGFNRYTILNLHALLSNNLLPNPAASGRLRYFGVGITKSVYTPLGIPQLIEEMFEMILQKTEQIEDPFEQAFFIMVQLPYLQPFDDVNKRVSRLAANIPLNRKNLSPLSFTEVPNELYVQGLLGIYELNKIDLLKDVFLWAYDRSAKQYAAQRQSLGDPDPFRLKYREAIRDLITEVVKDATPKEITITIIKVRALRLPETDQSKFVEAVETELMNLHEGNFARYQIRPSQFKEWKKVWNNEE
ncbi:MAG: Fic family protein [Ferruginibacter sp.]